MMLNTFGAVATKSLIALSILSASTAANAAACQPGTGCVLPIADVPPPPPATSAPPLESAPITEAAATTGGGISLVAILAALAALGLLTYLLLDDNDTDAVPLSPG